MSDPFVLGVNYWPRRSAMFFWRDFNADEVSEDFATIASIGMTVVRIFLLWEDWQPTPDTVSASALDHLGKVCDIATEHGLQLDVTFFTGHMSGPNWAPSWLLDADAPFPAETVRQVVSGGVPVPSSYRNMFHDETALAASELLLKTVVGRYKDHPAIWMWNLGNEPDLFAWPHSPEAGREWVRHMTSIIKAIDPVHPVTCGLHSESLLNDPNLRVHDVFAETDVAVIHGYPMYIPWAKRPLDTDFVPYLCAMTTALCGKPTLAEEWGAPIVPDGESTVWEWEGYGRQFKQFMVSEQDMADYVEGVLNTLLEVGSTGAMLWCFADYTEDLWDKPPCDESRHERHFGLVRADGSLKPHAEVVRRFAAKHPTVQPATRTVTLDITPDEYYQNPQDNLRRFYQDF
jgi:endo-1,4-beta-mannosidase